MNKTLSFFLIRATLLLVLVSAVLMPSDLLAQEPLPVEVSKQKIIYEGRAYYVHQVRKGQTLYSIAKAYNVTVNQIAGENDIRDNGIREGQILRIPVVKTPVSQDERYLYHTVKKGESLSSIAAEYGISVKDLRKANKGLLFPHEGDNLIIPRNKISPRLIEKRPAVAEDSAEVAGNVPDTTVTGGETEKFTVLREKTVVTTLNGSVRVAILLPFFIEENGKRSYTDSTKRDAQGKKIYREVIMPDDWIYEGSLPFLETYEGILIAADSLRSLGLNIELDVYDTGADSSRVNNLIWSGRLNDVDLIIGPVFSYNFDPLASFAYQHDIPVVSPVPLRDQNILRNRPSLYRVFPTARVSYEVLTDEIKSHQGSNVIFMYSDTLMSDPGTSEFWNRLTTETAYGSYDSTGRIIPCYFTGLVSRHDAYSGVSAIETLLRPDRENLIVLATTRSPVVSAVFSTLHSLSRKYDIKVFGLPEIRGLETIDLKYYYDLELFIPSDSYIDFNKPASKEFSAAFLKKFRTEPMAESFAWRGFDIAWYFIGGIASYGHDFLRDPGLFNPELLCLDPDFRRDSKDDGYENRGMFTLHYRKDMTIEVRRSRNGDRFLLSD